VAAGRVAEVLRQAVARRPVSIRGVPLTIQSASQVATGPPTFAIRVNKPYEIHFSYERYLVNALRQAFGFSGSPIRLSLRKAVGPPRGKVRR
jgi:GTPase